MEQWDAYDKYFNKINNKILLRGEPIPNGMFHLCSEIAVKHIDGTFLLTQRALNKNNGGKWELSAGGSVLKGESALRAAKRELFEETGINVQHLEEIGKVLDEIHQTLYTEFLAVVDCDKHSIILQKGETIDYQWVTEQQLQELSTIALVSNRILQFL